MAAARNGKNRNSSKQNVETGEDDPEQNLQDAYQNFKEKTQALAVEDMSEKLTTWVVLVGLIVSTIRDKSAEGTIPDVEKDQIGKFVKALEDALRNFKASGIKPQALPRSASKGKKETVRAEVWAYVSGILAETQASFGNIYLINYVCFNPESSASMEEVVKKLEYIRRMLTAMKPKAPEKRPASATVLSESGATASRSSPDSSAITAVGPKAKKKRCVAEAQLALESYEKDARIPPRMQKYMSKLVKKVDFSDGTSQEVIKNTIETFKALREEVIKNHKRHGYGDIDIAELENRWFDEDTIDYSSPTPVYSRFLQIIEAYRRNNIAEASQAKKTKREVRM